MIEFALSSIFAGAIAHVVRAFYFSRSERKAEEVKLGC
jgi:hypothetical protein